MRSSWKLGRVSGIDVFVHPTFLFVLLFPGVIAGGMPTIILTLAVFGFVLLHELGHALMARRFGIRTVDITLYPIGGVARLERLPRAPGAEILVALAGPAVNFAIAVALLGLGGILPGGGTNMDGLGEILDALVEINLVLGLFNLLPAFPMDGGRVLRASLSGPLGRVRATSVAASLGRALATLFVLFGIASLFNLIYIALGVFLYMSASAEEAHVRADEGHRSGGGRDDGVWVAPPGYRWVDRGQGVWQLAPVFVDARAGRGTRSRWN